MGTRYDLRSQQDADASAYASLPGTSEVGFVPHHVTPMKSLLAPGRDIPGCHPSRWIYELLNNDFTTCDLFQRARHAQIDSPYTWDHQHRLVINGNQSYVAGSTRILSAICLDCHFHFVFKMAWDEQYGKHLCNASHSSWPLQDNQFPWHHLVWAGSEADHTLKQSRTKYYPLLARENFACSAPPCTFEISLEISKPRFGKDFLDLIQDQEAIRQALAKAREREPARYEGATDDWASQAPLNLNTYLKNILESKPDMIRSISKRNKRFAVLFGPRCFSIFQELEFSEDVQERDGVDEGSFTPVYPLEPTGPSGTTELGTYRAYLEDVRAEVQCLIHKAGQSAERPTYCAPVLHFDLSCHEIPNIADHALINVEQYKLLGVLPKQNREVVVYAYKRQWELIPSRRRNLVDALRKIAHDSGDALLSDYAMMQSSVFDSQMQHQSTSDDDGLLSQALIFLGLQPPNNYSAESIIDAFRQRLARDPADASAARSMLLVIAQASTDDSYQAALVMESDTRMSLGTCKAVLGLTSLELHWKEVKDAALEKLEGCQGSDDREVVCDALEAIADHIDSVELREVALGLRHPPPEREPVNIKLPVGLNNIGNTCYLNSLLQYLFTVKPVRDIVLNYNDVRLELDDDVIEKRRIGGNKMQLDRGEAVVAQAFVQELATLFQDLETSDQAASRPSQRLANAVLLSTHTLLHATTQPSRAVSPMPPPLPARPPPDLPAKSTDDVDMVNVSVNSVPEAVETRSNSSSQTLVDKDDARSDQSYQKVDAVMESSSEPDMIVDTKETADAQAQDGQTTAPAALNEAELPLPASTETESASGQTESVDEKVLRALEYQKRSSGTDQQDVEEVMGSIINRLQAAIKPTTIDEKTGIQQEKIMETFFVTTVNYTKKFQEAEYQHEISFDRSITAFPAPEGPCSLYDALGRNFNQQILEESKLSRYTAIRTLPPVLHVLIQRSQSMGSKNGNPVVIPETLYLDRFMDAPHQSPEFKRRVEDWMLVERIDDIKSQLAKVKNNVSDIEFLESYLAEAGTQNVADGANGQTDQENWDFDGPVEDDFLLVSPSAPSTAPESYEATRPQGIQATQTAIQQMMETELKQLEERLETHVESMKNIPYRLQAVICHRGHLSSGHYWVWIHDFEENVWRWYNDADVKENNDTEDVLNTLSTSGEPYYLCYVRDEDKDEYVNVPKRQVAERKDSDSERKDSSSEQKDADSGCKDSSSERKNSSSERKDSSSELIELDQDGDVTLVDDTYTDTAKIAPDSPSKSIS